MLLANFNYTRCYQLVTMFSIKSSDLLYLILNVCPSLVPPLPSLSGMDLGRQDLGGGGGWGGAQDVSSPSEPAQTTQGALCSLAVNNMARSQKAYCVCSDTFLCQLELLLQFCYLTKYYVSY